MELAEYEGIELYFQLSGLAKNYGHHKINAELVVYGPRLLLHDFIILRCSFQVEQPFGANSSQVYV